MEELFHLEGNNMSLNHDFFRVPKVEIEKEKPNIKTFKANYHNVSVNDDIILYILDSLKWIPTYNPFKREASIGINYSGVTLIENNGLKKLYDIITGWILLFNNAPDTFDLKGNYIIQDNNTGHYEIINYDKNIMINNLTSFKEFILKTMDENEIIVHFGI